MYKKSKKYWRVNGKRTINGRPVKPTDDGAVLDKKPTFLGYYAKVNGLEKSLGKNKTVAMHLEARLLQQKLEIKRGMPEWHEVKP